MPRKVKNKLVPRIEKVFAESEQEILPFDTILTALGSERKSVLAGILCSYPERFDPAGSERLKDGKYESKRTLWRLIPDEELTIDEISSIYDLHDADLYSMLDEGERCFRWECWKALPDDNGTYNRRDIHYIIHRWRKSMAKLDAKLGRKKPLTQSA